MQSREGRCLSARLIFQCILKNWPIGIYSSVKKYTSHHSPSIWPARAPWSWHSDFRVRQIAHLLKCCKAICSNIWRVTKSLYSRVWTKNASVPLTDFLHNVRIRQGWAYIALHGIDVILIYRCHVHVVMKPQMIISFELGRNVNRRPWRTIRAFIYLSNFCEKDKDSLITDNKGRWGKVEIRPVVAVGLSDYCSCGRHCLRLARHWR